MARRLHGIMGNAFIGYRVVLCLLAGYALFIDENQPFIRKNKHIPDQLISPFDLLLRGKNPRILPLYIS
ncbi:hypothetical protein D3C74_497150 [compost metagenome]